MADIFEFDCAKYFNLSDFDSFEECSAIDPWFNTTHEEHEPQFVASMLGDTTTKSTDSNELESAPVAKVSVPIVKFDVKVPSANNTTRTKRVPEPLPETVPSKKQSNRFNTASSLAKTVRSSVPRDIAKSTKSASTRKTDTKPLKRNSVSTKSSEEDALLLMLKQHNKKFAPVAAYVPPMHSVREVRQWEKLTGKHWNSLSQTQRQEANEEISELKHAKRII